MGTTETDASAAYDCAECGLCCIYIGGMLHLHQEDKARFASENKTALMERFAGTTADQACPFLLPVLPTQGFARDSQPFRCAIYDDRPLVCREFEIGGRHCRELRAKRGLPI